MTQYDALRKSEPPIGDKDEFSRGYRLGNRDGIEFAIEQIEGRLNAAMNDPLHIGKGWRLTIKEVMEAMRHGT